jgi:hypothetical protein
MHIHLIRISLVVLLALMLIFLPYFPGSYDSMAVNISMSAQLVSFGSLILVPIGIIWLIHERRLLLKQTLNSKRYGFALSSFAASLPLAFLSALPAFGNSGKTAGILVLAGWCYAGYLILPLIRALKSQTVKQFNAVPAYFVSVPILIVLVRTLFIPSAVLSSRNLAIRNSAELIRDIEAFHRNNGHYPASLASLWKDYRPSVIGIREYGYETNGDSYNIYFEQFATDLATREIVVYNKEDRQEFTSHDSWILLLPRERLNRSRGYFEVCETGIAHWKYFWFD